jgi:leucyl-tRNA synthetase
VVNLSKIEKKWQEHWESKKIFQVKESKKKKFYCLEMFPYPSGSGLHMGHAFNYTIGDIQARFKRMNGYNVLYPMGYDSFGLPAENAAIKANVHPKKYTEKAIVNFIKQQKKLGLSYDWSRLIKTSDPNYYKWNQFFFLELMKKGLIYRKKANVNWCPKCNTVLANEQVHNGKCWRHEDTEVETKQLEQWFIKTTKYVDELLKGIEKLDWPERIKIMQKNWIGKSKGTTINFKVETPAHKNCTLEPTKQTWQIFTTRPDTIYGVTFMVISAQHERLWELVTFDQEKKVEIFLKKLKSVSEKNVGLDKEGAFTGSYAIHPLTKEKIPIYAGNFIVADYGSGMVMAVPAHDQRDFEFAKKYEIPIKIVIQNKEKNLKELEKAYTQPGNLVNSKQFNKLDSEKAKQQIANYLKTKKIGKESIQYKLKDWLVSRQRYWGTPIPVIYCKNCGIVPEKKLPVKLPEKIKFGKGNPLETNKDFLNTKCPKCGKPAKRETDTMDTFFDSSWYFLRYADPKNNKEPFDKKKLNYWIPVDQYIGGAEHACMHLIYARFFTKALRDLGFVNIDEPFKKLFNQGMLHGTDGEKMSKSKGNVILPETVSKKYGIDAARLFLVSIASPDKDLNWSEKGIEGSFKFINKIFNYFDKVKIGKTSKKIESKLNQTIKEITEYIEDFKYNLAIIKIRELFNSFETKINKKDLESFIKILLPFCPHLAEELWEKIGNKSFVSLEEWPKYDSKKINLKFESYDELIQNTIKDIHNISKIVKIVPKRIIISVAEAWRYSLIKKIKKEMEKTRDISKIIKKVMIKEHAKDISKKVPMFVKNPTKLPKIVLSQEEEYRVLTENIKLIKKEFKVEIEIKKNGLKAIPGKPEIIIK